MLQRIYGTAWAKKEDQDAYLRMLEEAEKRDHRRLARQLDLFICRTKRRDGVWHRTGGDLATDRAYMRRVYQDNGYQEVKCPQFSTARYGKNPALDNSGKHVHHGEREPRLRVKADELPATCRYSITICAAIVNCRCVTGSSAHATATSPRRAARHHARARFHAGRRAHLLHRSADPFRVSHFIDLLIEVYRDFGFDDIIYKLSTRPAKRVGSDATWDVAEKALAEALDGRGVKWETVPGEGAFYGPKIEFSLQDSIGRVWQCGTIQVDFSMPGGGCRIRGEDNAAGRR